MRTDATTHYSSIPVTNLMIGSNSPSSLSVNLSTPIFKKDDRTLFTNYRPISLLPIFSKVIEKVICIQINDLFVENKLFFNHQYGFRSGHSTELAAL